MIDKKISLGTLITIATIGGTIIFTQGATSHKMESMEADALETKIDEGFKRLETLIIEN